jgi:hypothetical protein
MSKKVDSIYNSNAAVSCDQTTSKSNSTSIKFKVNTNATFSSKIYCLTRGSWRRTLCFSFLLNLIATITILLSLINSKDAGLQIIQGYFCLHDTSLCPSQDFNLHPTLNARPTSTICTTSTITTTHAQIAKERINSTDSSDNLSISCFDRTTDECVVKNGVSQTLNLINGIISDGRMRLLDVPLTQRWQWIGIGCLALHTITFMMFEIPLERTSYSSISKLMPERIFMETSIVILSIWILKVIVLGFLTLTVYQAYTFPSEASCEDINAFPNNDDIQKAMESRSQFLKECLYLQNQCNVRLAGISATWKRKETAEFSSFVTSVGFAGVTLLVANVWKWCVWSCCVAKTVIDDGERIDTNQQDTNILMNNLNKKEQFEEAIRRIQLKKKMQREKQMYRETGRKERNADERNLDGVWDGETSTSRSTRMNTPITLPSSSSDLHSSASEMFASSNYVTSTSNKESNSNSSSIQENERPVVKVVKEENSFSQLTCIICLDDLNGSNDMNEREALFCGHVFHTECIQMWFESGGQGKLCPICRTDVSGDGINDRV